MSIATATITRVIVREAPNGNRTISVRINYVSTIGFGEHTTTAFFDETDPPGESWTMGSSLSVHAARH